MTAFNMTAFNMTAFNIAPLEAKDIPQCITIYFDSFQNAHSLACWPRTDGIRSWWEKMFRDELHEPGSYWFKAVDPITNALAGFCKWVEPRPGVEPDTHLPQWPEDADQALCDETFGAWASRRKELMQARSHWYLEIIAVDPKYQRKGLGSLLMRFGVEKADEQRVEAYLEASPEGERLYSKHGFRTVDHLDTMIANERVPAQTYRNLFMIRSASD